MTSGEPATASPAIAQDIPCITCGYNLRGLDPARVCPECGTPIQRSVDARMKLIMSSPRIWARMVLGGLAAWVLITPYLLCSSLLMGYNDVGRSAQWLNYPGPKVWIVPMLRQVSYRPELSIWDLAPTIGPAVVAVAIYLITWPRHPGSRIEKPVNLRSASRWLTLAATGGAFMLCVIWLPNTNLISPVLGTFAIGVNELPCTVLVHLYVSNLAFRLDLRAEALALNVVGWITAGAMAVSISMLIMGVNTLLFRQNGLAAALFWFYGAVVGTAAVVAMGSLIRLAMALWPLAFGKPSGSIR